MVLRGAVLLLVLPAAAAGAQPLADENAVVRVVVSVETAEGDRHGIGSGFFVNHTHIVTNEHVVAVAESPGGLFISFPHRDALLPVSLASANPNLDLAVLAYRGGEVRESLALSTADPIRGAEVFALGYPGSADIGTVGPTPSSTLTSGILSRPPFRVRWGRLGALVVRALQHTAPINPGSSGGPLVNACGQVIGVNTSGAPAEIRDEDGDLVGLGTAQGIFFALAASELIRELEGLRVDFSIAPECEPEGATPAPGGSVSRRAAWLLPLLVLLALAVVVFGRRRRPQRVAPDGPQAATPVLAGGSATTVAPAPGPAPLPSAVVRFVRRSGAPALELGASELAGTRHGISVGRHPGLVDRPLSDPALSRRHFRVSIHDGRVFVEDLQSTHGTFVNGEGLKPYHARRLKPGDTVRAGRGEWRLNAPE